MHRAAFRVVFILCNLLAWPISILHYLSVRARLVKTCECVSRHQELSKTLRNIWHTHLVKRAIPVFLNRAPAQVLKNLFQIQNPTSPIGGQVFAMFHSPWGRLFAAYSQKNDLKFLIMTDSANWASRIMTIPSYQPGRRKIRELIKLLHQGYQVAIAANVSSKKQAVPVSFLGRNFMASSLPARMAAAAHVPLTPVTFRLSGLKIEVICGPSFTVSRCDSAYADATLQVYGFFEANILNTPCICNNVRNGDCFIEKNYTR